MTKIIITDLVDSIEICWNDIPNRVEKKTIKKAYIVDINLVDEGVELVSTKDNMYFKFYDVDSINGNNVSSINELYNEIKFII